MKPAQGKHRPHTGRIYIFLDLYLLSTRITLLEKSGSKTSIIEMTNSDRNFPTIMNSLSLSSLVIRCQKRVFQSGSFGANGTILVPYSILRQFSLNNKRWQRFYFAKSSFNVCRRFRFSYGFDVWHHTTSIRFHCFRNMRRLFKTSVVIYLQICIALSPFCFHETLHSFFDNQIKMIHTSNFSTVKHGFPLQTVAITYFRVFSKLND